MTAKEIIPDKQLMDVFSELYYGPNTHPRNKLREILLKTACGYIVGSGSTHFMRTLGLLDETEVLTKLSRKGREYLYAAFEPDFTNHI